MGDEAANSKNEVHELENWRIRIRREEGCADKWEDWWGWMVKVRLLLPWEGTAWRVFPFIAP